MTAEINGAGKIDATDIPGLSQDGDNVKFDVRSLPGFLNTLGNLANRYGVDSEKFMTDVVWLVESSLAEGIMTGVGRRDPIKIYTMKKQVYPLSKLE
jgi:hypothetical protein